MRASTIHYFSATNATWPGPGSSYHQDIPTMTYCIFKHEPKKKNSSLSYFCQGVLSQQQGK